MADGMACYHHPSQQAVVQCKEECGKIIFQKGERLYGKKN